MKDAEAAMHEHDGIKQRLQITENRSTTQNLATEKQKENRTDYREIIRNKLAG